MEQNQTDVQKMYEDYRKRMSAYPPQDNRFLPSLIPVETFPVENEAAQQEALLHSPQMQSFAAYRKRAKDDLLNPSYHFYAPNGRLNDPNGLCYWNGCYHLFYQVFAEPDMRPHWGHMYSEDMVHWKDLPLALYPDDRSYSPWSGNTLVEEDRVIAMYHGRWAGNCIAISSDPLLLNWAQSAANPVIPLLPDRAENNNRPYDVFDPCIWKEEDGYYSLSGIYYGPHEKRGRGIHNRMVEHLFHSKDLEHWVYMGELAPSGFPQMPEGNDGACPYFLPLGNRYVLFFFSHKSGAYAIWGDYDKQTHRFVPDRIHQFNFGPVGCSSYQAPCAMVDGKGGVYLVFNTTDRDRTLPRQGVMSLMYHVTLAEDNQLRIAPVEQVSSLHGELFQFEQMPLPMFEEQLLDVRGRALDLQFQFQKGDASAIKIQVLKSADGREHTDIVLHMPCIGHRPERYFLTIDSTNSSLKSSVLSRMPESTQIDLGQDEELLDVRILLDRCTLEVFVNNRVVLMQMVYPALPDSDHISITAMGGNATLENAKIWNMKSIYE